ncbi:MAG TPA: hypothetical protein DCX89_05505, partial [Saprospirales bacterium]|nr:hypothetical protein [Saprospirales bacterium]
LRFDGISIFFFTDFLRLHTDWHKKAVFNTVKCPIMVEFINPLMFIFFKEESLYCYLNVQQPSPRKIGNYWLKPPDGDGLSLPEV